VKVHDLQGKIGILILKNWIIGKNRVIM